MPNKITGANAGGPRQCQCGCAGPLAALSSIVRRHETIAMDEPCEYSSKIAKVREKEKKRGGAGYIYKDNALSPTQRYSSH